MNGKTLTDRGGDEVEEREHRENCNEHAVVDDGWIAGFSIVDDVADQGHYEKRPEELQLSAWPSSDNRAHCPIPGKL